MVTLVVSNPLLFDWCPMSWRWTRGVILWSVSRFRVGHAVPVSLSLTLEFVRTKLQVRGDKHADLCVALIYGATVSLVTPNFRVGVLSCAVISQFYAQ